MTWDLMSVLLSFVLPFPIDIHVALFIELLTCSCFLRHVQAVVESTVNGRKVYEKLGFRTVQEMQFDFPEKFTGRQKPCLRFMRRSARQR